MQTLTFETADSQNQVGKQRHSDAMSSSNRKEAERRANTLGRDRFGANYSLDTEAVPNTPQLTRFVVVSGDERVPVESPTWW